MAVCPHAPPSSCATGATSTGATGCGERMYMLARRTLRWSLVSSASATSGTRHFPFRLRTAMLRSRSASSDAHPRPARAAHISFALLAGTLLSVLKIDQLKLSAEMYKPYKVCMGGRWGPWGRLRGGSSGKEDK
jgi:hypothetical protein